MWKLFKYDGHYIQGEFISKHSSEAAAIKKAEKVIKHTYAEKSKLNKDIIIWLDGEDHMPLGMIIKKTR